MNKIVTVIWIDENTSRKYISRMSTFLRSFSSFGYVTTPMENKAMSPLGIKTKFYRPMVIFDFDPNKESQKCFAYSTIKNNSKEENDGLINFKIPGHEKVMLNCPILAPTKYLEIFDFKTEIKHEHQQVVKDHLEYLFSEYRETVKQKDAILYQYKCIKYGSDYKGLFDPRDVQKAHNKMINEEKVEKFCKQELKLIEQQELLINKTKQNESGGSSGTPIEENSQTIKKDITSAHTKTGTEIWREYEERVRQERQQNVTHVHKSNQHSKKDWEHEKEQEMSL